MNAAEVAAMLVDTLNVRAGFESVISLPDDPSVVAFRTVTGEEFFAVVTPT